MAARDRTAGPSARARAAEAVATWRSIGPGLVIAATGVGAGDLVAAMLAGARFGEAVLWGVVIGAATKFALNEGIGRWQLATGSTLLEGWCRHLPPWLQIALMTYVVGWGLVVGAGLMSACGIAAHALVPGVPVAAWGAVHSPATVLLVLLGRYHGFEALMKGLIALMVVGLVGGVATSGVPPRELAAGLLPRIPRGAGSTLLSLMGGIGGSVTLLSYGYWIREKGWTGRAYLGRVRVDLAVGYALTGVFGMAVLLLSARVLAGGEALSAGSRGLIALADALAGAVQPRWGVPAAAAVRWLFLLGVWGTVFTSMLGVWQGVPYLFADFRRARRGGEAAAVSTRSPGYRPFLLYLAVAPMPLLWLGRPLWMIQLYTLVSSLFLPLLGGSLLWLNTRSAVVGRLRYGVWAITAVCAALVLCGIAGALEAFEALRG